ncbi:MAG: hypothetical protein M0R48_07420 [Candidatus Omnitrophica bacterium]|jgi:hypothetical protein|nr:hypothetical protein [Candidatus Omnitrophota bacterium]
MRKLSIFDLISLGILALIVIFSAVRFNYLPQFIDGYYHLSVANGFIKSGGWVGWAWWDFAPFGRPHLYPPFYHLILTFLIKSGFSGLNALRLTEVLIVPLFFFFLWFVSRRLTGDKIAFLALSITSSFFAFYSSVSANVPASLALIFGLLTWLFLKKKKWVSAAIFMSFCFYSHAGIPWMFFTSLLTVTIFNREYRKLALKVILASIIIFMPFIFHEARYLKSIHLSRLMESNFISFNLGVISFALVSMYLNRRNRNFAVLLFWGYFIASALIFIKYPYRFFCAQGFVGFAFFASLGLLAVSNYFGKKNNLFLVLISLYLFFINATVKMEENKIKFNVFDSTFYSLFAQKAYEDITFRPIFSEKFYPPIIKAIQQNSSTNDIISSNIIVAAQIFSSLSDRPSNSSILKEVQPENKFLYSDYAKLIVLIKPILKEDMLKLKGKKLNLIFENDITQVFLNRDFRYKEFTKTAPFKFVYVYLAAALIALLALYDNLWLKKPKSP